MAVSDVDLEVEKGEVFAFLGPNGAGKTTTISILEGYLERDAGRAKCSARIPPMPAGMAGTGRLCSPGLPQEGADCPRDARLYAGYYDRPRSVPRRSSWSASPTRPTTARASSREASSAVSMSPGADRRRRASLPRRADHRLRPVRAAAGLGGDLRPPRPRQDRDAHDPLHGRGAGARRPRRGDRRGRDHRRAGRPTISAGGRTPPAPSASTARAGARPVRESAVAGDWSSDNGRLICERPTRPGASTSSPAGRWRADRARPPRGHAVPASRTSTWS